MPVSSDTISIVNRDLSGSTPSPKGSGGSKGVSRSLIMETSLTSKESKSTSSAATSLTSESDFHGSSSTPVNENHRYVCSPTSSVSSSTPISPNMISKYLVQYIPPPLERIKASETRATGSCVLTSAEGIAILREKDEKRKGKEGKERMKQEKL